MLETWKLSFKIVYRNWLVYRKDLISNISPTVTDPAFYILSLGLGLGAYVTEMNGRSYMEFLAPGMAVSSAMWTAFFETSYGFYVRMTFENVFKAMLTTPIGVREIIIGEFMWVSFKGAVMIFGVSLALMPFGLFKNPLNLLLIPFVGVLVALPLGALGLIASCLIRNINQFQITYSLVISPLYFFSGVFFPVESMPSVLKTAAACLPLYHGVLAARSLYWDENIVQAMMTSVPVLIMHSVVLLTIAYWLVSKKLQE